FDRCQFSDRKRRRTQPCRQLGFVCPDFGRKTKRHFRERSGGDTGRELLLGSAGEGHAGTKISLWTHGARIREAIPNDPASLAAPIAWTVGHNGICRVSSNEKPDVRGPSGAGFVTAAGRDGRHRGDKSGRDGRGRASTRFLERRDRVVCLAEERRR